MRVSLFFGSFNPLHFGHVAIAESIFTDNLADEVWLVVSPQNPMKENVVTDKELRARNVEDELKKLSLEAKIKVCRIEFDMPIPSFTIDTLKRITTEYSDIEFSIVMGEDNLRAFHKWKDYKIIAEMVKIYVYPRKGNDYNGISEINIDVKSLKNIEYIKNVGLLDISSSAIRKAQEHYQKGLELQEQGHLHKALNEFILSQELIPDNKEVNSRIEMIKNIFQYSYKEFINV